MTHTVALIKRFPPDGEKSHWVWILRYWNKDGSKRLSEAIGWYAPARDPWRPKWSKGPRLTESQVREIQIQRRNDLREGRIVERTVDSQEKEVCRQYVPFGQWIETYLEQTRGTIRPTTLKVIRDALYMLESKIHPKAIETLDHIMVKKYIKLRNDDGVAHSTVWKEISSFRRVWYDLRVKENPWADPKIRRLLKFAEKAWYWYQPEEFQKLMDACDDYRQIAARDKKNGRCWLIYKGMMALGYTGGLRLGEISHLTWSDVNLEAGTIEIAPRKETEHLLGWGPKDHERRMVPLSTLCRQILEEMLLARDKDNPYIFLTDQRRRWILSQAKTGMWKGTRPLLNNTRREFHRLCKRAGLPLDEFHSLRKSCCTNLLEGGMPPHSVQKLMGHSSVETTIKYYSKIRRNHIDVARQIVDRTTGVSTKKIPHAHSA